MLMKKIIIFFIFLATFFSISAFLPNKAFALNCSNGVSGQFLDENGSPVANVGWQLTTNGITDPSSSTQDHMQYGLSDSQGKFTTDSSNGSLVLSWTRNTYLSEEINLVKCLDIIITLKKLGPNTQPSCGKSCQKPEDCANATDGCTSCVSSICAHPSWGENTALCCPYGYQDTDCGHPVHHPIWDSNTECCKYLGLGFWEFELKIPCGTIIEPVDPTCQNGEGVNTALGCIPVKEPSKFVNWLVEFAIGIGGGIAFLLMLFGAFQIILSGGNPDRVKAGREMITAAIGGLLLIIFSVLILRIIGVDLLAIPGFKK